MMNKVIPSHVDKDLLQTSQTNFSRRRFFALGAKASLTSMALVSMARAELIIGTGANLPSSESATTPPQAFPEFSEPTILQFSFAQIKADCEAIRTTGVPMHLVAPSGFGSDEQRNFLAIHRLTQAGFYIDNPEVVDRKYLRFAGTDDERMNDLKVYLDKPVEQLPKILLGVRGGYGAMRILPKLTHTQWQTLTQKFKQRGTLMMGFSDFTALQLGVLAQGNMPAVAGAMLGSDFGKEVVNTDTIQSFINLCQNKKLSILVTDNQPYTTTKAPISGKIWGGNLSVLASLVGTPYMPKVDNGILFIEDVGEQPYRLERMLQTLRLAGILATQKAIILGKFNFKGETDVYASEYTFDTVIRDLQATTRLPIFTEFPFGHVAQRINFPLGVPATILPMTTGYRVDFEQFDNLLQEKNYPNVKFEKLFV